MISFFLQNFIFRRKNNEFMTWDFFPFFFFFFLLVCGGSGINGWWSMGTMIRRAASLRFWHVVQLGPKEKIWTNEETSTVLSNHMTPISNIAMAVTWGPRYPVHLILIGQICFDQTKGIFFPPNLFTFLPYVMPQKLETVKG